MLIPSVTKNRCVRLLKMGSLTAVGLLVLLQAAFAAPVDEETAGIVAERYLSHVVALKGDWGGSEQPSILKQESVIQDDLVVAYNFIISPQGHILVSGDDELTPVLLYSDTSTFVPERVSVSGSIESVMIPDLQTRVKSVQSKAVKASVSTATPVSEAWDRYGSVSKALIDTTLPSGERAVTVGPYITTSWGQGSPYNLLTPSISGRCTHTVTGCVATALSQLMNYWEWPEVGTGSHSYYWSEGNQTLSATFNTYYNWSAMLDSLSESSTEEAKNAVAKLMADVGVAVEMDYGCDSSSSSAWANNILDTYFGYKSSMTLNSVSNFTSDNWFALFKTELDATPPRPLVFSIWETGGGGHETVVDGYQTGITNKVHINLGWEGYNDGYYDISQNFDAGGYTWLGSYQYVVNGIEPDQEVTEIAAQVMSVDAVDAAIAGSTVTFTANIQNTGSEILPTGALIRFWVRDASGSGETVATVSCAGLASGETAAYSASWDIPETYSGTYFCHARVYNSSTSISDWSSPVTFNISGGGSAPSAPALTSPSGTISETAPTFVWEAVSTAETYYLWVSGTDGVVIQLPSLNADTITSSSVCRYASTVTLSNGDYTWWVQAANSYGTSAWSSSMSFTVSATTAGVPQIIQLYEVTDAMAGSAATLWVQVGNTGSGPLSSGTKAWFYVAGPAWSESSHWVASADISDIASGETAWKSAEWEIPAAAVPNTYIYWVQIWNGNTALSDWSMGQTFTVSE